MALSNDSPIGEPKEDIYGLDPFARALAKSIERMQAPEGVVLAINGPWGSGKSSAINLISFHLNAAVENGELVPVTFNPWWFQGADALTFSFFRELSAGLGDTLSDKVRKSLSKVGAGVSAFGPILGAAANLKAPGLGKIVEGGASMIGKLTKHEKTLDQEHKTVAEALRQQSKRFVVVIDDIDRLSTDDALTVFRLVKSVGRLPNVIYLLSFDRALAEKAVTERFPSEGPGYLEKIVQGAFDIPPPMADALRSELVNAAVAVMGEPPERLHVRFWNVFMDVIIPLVRTPRDIIRIANDLKVTWPAVAEEVDRTDFLAMSAIKLLHPEIYAAIRAHPEELCGLQSRSGRRNDALQTQYDQMLGLAGLADEERLRWRQALRRLFPRLDAVWSNTYRSDDEGAQRDRQIASRKHFNTYFAFSLSQDLLPSSEIRTLIERGSDQDFVRDYLRQALAVRRRDGSTKAALVLDELMIHSATVPEATVTPLLSAIFSIADELDVEADQEKGFMGMANNSLRIHWLCNRMVTDRFDMPIRDGIYEAAAKRASFAWGWMFAERCRDDYDPNPRPRSGLPSPPLVTEATAKKLARQSLTALRAAAKDGSLVRAAHLPRLLFDWSRRTTRGIAEVRCWTDAQLANDEFVVAMAKATTSIATTTSMGWDGDGDRVSRQVARVDFKPYEKILDTARLATRVDEVLAASSLTDAQSAILLKFKSAPRGSHMSS